jgi:hypothetical protein
MTRETKGESMGMNGENQEMNRECWGMDGE